MVVPASILIFLVMRLIPGDPAALLAGPEATPADVEALRNRLGLNDPLIEQYVNWLGGAVQGDFGQSFTRSLDVDELMKTALLPSAELAIAGYAFVLVFGIPFGIFAGLKPGGFPDYVATGFTMFTLGIPNSCSESS